MNMDVALFLNPHPPAVPTGTCMYNASIGTFIYSFYSINFAKFYVQPTLYSAMYGKEKVDRINWVKIE